MRGLGRAAHTQGVLTPRPLLSPAAGGGGGDQAAHAMPIMPLDTLLFTGPGATTHVRVSTHEPAFLFSVFEARRTVFQFLRQGLGHTGGRGEGGVHAVATHTASDSLQKQEDSACARGWASNVPLRPTLTAAAAAVGVRVAPLR